MKQILITQPQEKATFIIALNEYSKCILDDPNNTHLGETEKYLYLHLCKSSLIVPDVDIVIVHSVENIELLLKVMTYFKCSLSASLKKADTDKHPLLKVYFEKRLEITAELIQKITNNL